MLSFLWERTVLLLLDVMTETGSPPPKFPISKDCSQTNIPILTSLAGLGLVRVSPALQTLWPCACLPMEKNCPASPGTQGQNWDSTSYIAYCDRLEEIVGLKYFMCGGKKGAGAALPCPVTPAQHCPVTPIPPRASIPAQQCLPVPGTPKAMLHSHPWSPSPAPE